MNDEVGRVLGGRYRLVAPIGVGASAQVYLADDVTLRRRVAVKLLHRGLAEDEAFLKRFRAEAQSAAQLSHPHIMAVHDWGEEDVPYLVTEYLGGGSLRAMLDRERTLTLSQVLLVGLESARALEHAHGRGFVHRDLKPANLIFGEEGRLRVADFGLARALAEAAWTEPEGAVLGTARYASPEQAQGHSVDGKADIYSLALIMVEAATARVPFSADTTIATLMARVDNPLDPGAALGPLQPVLRRAGSPDPEDRPDAGELVVALMARAEELERPEPFPLAGTAPLSAAALDLADPTEIGAETVVRPADVAAVAAATAESDDPSDGTDADDDAPPSRSARADRDRPRRWPWVVLVLVLLAAAGGAAAWATWGSDVLADPEVPDLTGMTLAEIEDIAAANEWLLEVNELRQSDTEAGDVIAQQPDPGVELPRGETLSVTFSVGPPQFVLPTGLVGLQEEEAVARLQSAIDEGARLAESFGVFDEEIPEGQVMAVKVGDTVVDDAEPDQAFDEGSFVELTVSQGPEPRVLESYVGMSFADGLAAVEALGLTAGETREFDDDIPENQIISQNPAAGESVPKGANIDFVVSAGPRLVAVPEVAGQDVTAACDEIKAQELVCGGVEGSVGNPVTATTPGAGENVRPGTTVDLVTS